MPDVFDAIINLRREGRDAALCTLIRAQGSTPGRESFKMVVDASGALVAGTVGGGCLEGEVMREAARAIQEGAPRLSIHVLTEKEAAKTGLICGGKVEVFIEPLVSHRVYIFGGGHVGREVEALARRVGFSTTVIDDREEFASRARFPEAGDVRRLDFAAWPEHVVIGPNAYIVILTRGHEHDEIVLAGALKTPARYIGMIGSARKVKRTYDRMLKKGDEKVTEAALARVEAPIGIDIGSRTSEEIAVSIVARLIQVKNEGKG